MPTESGTAGSAVVVREAVGRGHAARRAAQPPQRAGPGRTCHVSSCVDVRQAVCARRPRGLWPRVERSRGRGFRQPVERPARGPLRANGRPRALDTWTRTTRARVREPTLAALRALTFARRILDAMHAPDSRTSAPRSGAANGDALGAVRSHAARRRHVRRERLLARRPAPAPAEGRLQAAAEDARAAASRSTPPWPTPSRQAMRSGRWRRAPRTTRTGSSR